MKPAAGESSTSRTAMIAVQAPHSPAICLSRRRVVAAGGSAKRIHRLPSDSSPGTNDVTFPGARSLISASLALSSRGCLSTQCPPPTIAGVNALRTEASAAAVTRFNLHTHTSLRIIHPVCYDKYIAYTHTLTHRLHRYLS